MARALVFFAFLCTLPVLSQAQDTLYVTDKLFLGLYAKPEAGGESLATLVSGTPLQTLERGKYFTRVRTPDGSEGWVKSAYLVDEKPPRLMLEELQNANDKLTRQVDRVHRELEMATQTAARASTQLQAERDQRRVALGQLESENRTLQQRVDSQGIRVPLPWLVGAAVFCLAFGLWGGYAWIDYRIRRRHGGFRIY